jgi:cobalt-zinc-cadmium efflux system outer membrane protein
MRAVAIGLWLCLLALPAFAQLPVGVEELVARALEINPELRAARSEVEAGKGRLLQAGFRPNPMLDLSGSKNVAGPDNMLMISISWPLDLGGRKDARVAVAARDLALAEARVAERERQMATDVRAKAGELLATRLNLRIIDDLLALNRAAQSLVGQRVREGAAPPLHESLLLVEITRLEAQRAGQAGRLEALRLQLARLIGVAPPTSLEVGGDLETVPPTPAPEQATQQALERRPDLRMAGLEDGLARARVDRERAEGRFDASLFGQYQRQETGFDLMGMNGAGNFKPIMDVFHMVSFGVSITLPVRHQNQGNVAAALADVEGARRRREATELLVRQEVASAYAQSEAAARAAQIYRAQVLETARRNFAVVRQSYELGRLGLLDVIAEQRRLIELETGFTDVLKQRWDAVVDLQRAIGVTR